MNIVVKTIVIVLVALCILPFVPMAMFICSTWRRGIRSASANKPTVRCEIIPKERVAIAKWLGVKPLAENDGDRKVHIETFGVDPGPWGFIERYEQDLNAMHEAELRLGKNIEKYRITLLKVCYEMNTWACEATAAQRAEALLRTIGKWEGGAK